MSNRGKSRRTDRVGTGALVVVSLLLALSAALRMGGGPGLAFAREALANVAPSDLHDTQSCPATGESGALLATLQRRDKDSQQRADALQQKERTLALVRTQIDQQLLALEQAEARLRSTIALADEAAESDLSRLTSVYENMKPKEAAALFEQMAPEFAAGFLGRMRAEAAAAVLAGMSPQAAYTVSVLLAGRNAEVPRK